MTLWKEYRIGDLGEIVTGKTPPTSEKQYFGDRYPFITPTDMRGQKKATHVERYLSQEGANLLRNGELPPNSVAVSCIGWQMGKVIMTVNKSFTNQQLNSIIPYDFVNSDFLYYALSNRRRELMSVASGAGVRTPILNKSVFSQLAIGIPPLKVQSNIGKILSAFDELISINSRRVEILAQTAKLIYDEWFVKFKFPGHEKVKMVDSALGAIPEGWEVKKISDVVTNVKDSISRDKLLPNLHYMPIDVIPRKSMLLREIAPLGQAQSSLTLFKKGDIVFGSMRAYFHKVIIAPFDGVTRKTCFVLRSKASNLWSFSYLTLFQDSTIEYASLHSNGATIPYAVWENGLANKKVVMPSSDVLERFEVSVSPMLQFIMNTFFKNRNLATTRDFLLPKLISGEIDVSRVDIPGVRWKSG